MKSSAKKVELAPYDDLFSTEESRQDAKLEKVQEIPLSELHPFKNHPFKVKDDEAMLETADSVRQYGVLVPAIARPDPEGGYELVAGHRRHRASELAEKETMPVIVRDLDDDAATIIMVDSNLQRESLLPSERAFAYQGDWKKGIGDHLYIPGRIPESDSADPAGRANKPKKGGIICGKKKQKRNCGASCDGDRYNLPCRNLCAAFR